MREIVWLQNSTGLKRLIRGYYELYAPLFNSFDDTNTSLGKHNLSELTQAYKTWLALSTFKKLNL